MAADGLHEDRGALPQVFGILEQRAADEQHGVGSEEFRHRTDAIDLHAAGGSRERGLDATQRRAQRVGQVAAFLLGKGKPPARIREDRNIAAEQAEDGSQEHGRRHAVIRVVEMRAGERGMSHHDHRIAPCQGGDGIRADEQRRHQHAFNPLPLGKGELCLDLIETAGDHGEIKRVAAGFGVGVIDGVLAPGDTILKRVIDHVGQTMVVLDEIETAECEGLGHVRKLGGVRPMGFRALHERGRL